MAIFVSNPTSAAVPALSNDALDPLAVAPEEGFTEELAAAMQPAGAALEALDQTRLDKLAEADQNSSGLQILPAEVLMNAVEDANFALTGQAGSASANALNLLNTSAALEAQEIQLQDRNAIELNQIQGAELAAANLAAQMAAALVAPPASVAARAQELQALEASAASGASAASAATSLAQNSAGLSTQNLNADNAAQAPVIQTMAGTTAIENKPAHLVPSVSTQAKLDALKSAGDLGTVASNTSSLGGPLPGALAASAGGKTQAPESSQVGTTPTQKLDPVLANSASTSLPSGASSISPSMSASISSAATSSSSAEMSANSAGVSARPASEATLMATAGALASTPATAQTPLAQAVKADSVSAQKSSAAIDSKAEIAAKAGKETAFNFDAKISSNEALSSKATATNSASPTALSIAPSFTQAAAASTPPTSSLGLQAVRSNEGMASSAPVSATVSAQASTLPLEQAISAQDPSLESFADLKLAAQSETRPDTAQSLEDLSSAFVSSLVGGPQRPVTTVMDWVSLQAQQRPAPVVPHEVSLDSGAVQLEIQKMVKQGGGHVVMELTPPDQSKFTIELKLDERGGALLIVEGVSDSTRTRLEQSAPQLREQFQQMGLELQLDMRQQGQSGSSSAANFSNSQERESGDNASGNPGANDTPKNLTQREAGANRARETGSNQVYLYA
jgi:hypothetical protein